MTKEEAIRLIILDYCKAHNITPTNLGEKAGISKSHIHKIMNLKWGKFGISMTYTEMIANSMGYTMVEFQEMIDKYKQNEKCDLKTKPLINKINRELENFSEEDLVKIDNIINNINSEKLDIILNLLKNMK